MNRDKMAKVEREERKWQGRDRKLRKRKNLDMTGGGRSVFLIQEIIGKKAKPRKEA